MNFELLSTLARLRVEDLRAEASAQRALRRAYRPGRASLRMRAARAVRAAGYVALSLGDALADTR